MKKLLQIVQKYIFPTMIVMFGVLFIYGLIFATPVRTLVLYLLESGGSLQGANPDKGIEMSSTIRKFLEQFPEALTIVRYTNSFSNRLLILSVIGLVLTGLAFLLRSQLRKKYYITNIVSVGALSLYSLGVGGYCLFFITRYIITLCKMDLVELNKAIPSYLHYPNVEGFGIYHILGFIISLLILVFAILIFLILVVKIISRFTNRSKKA